MDGKRQGVGEIKQADHIPYMEDIMMINTAIEQI